MVYSLTSKDLRQHGPTLFVFLLGTAIAVALALQQNFERISGVSPLQVLHTALLTLIPLLAFILGQRLIVSEYMGKTQMYLESLPARRVTLISVKFIFGLLVVWIFACLILASVAFAGRIVDSMDSRYFTLLLVKTLSISALQWSIVFCFSLAGFLRVALYSCLLILILAVVLNPALDQTRLAPFALMDRPYFLFERDIVPWRDLAGTGVWIIFFCICGFAMALYKEGAYAERLAKPLSRRDVAFCGLLVLSALTLVGAVSVEPVELNLSSNQANSVSEQAPEVSVTYRRPEFKATAQTLLQVTHTALSSFQQKMGLTNIPPIAIVQDNTLETQEIVNSTGDQILLKINIEQYDTHLHHTLATVALHEVLQYQSNRRLSFEPIHWLLDGISRWWVESQPQLESHDNSELLALAVNAQQQLEPDWTLDEHWQLIADRVGYPAAEAMAYSAILFLQEQTNVQTIEALSANTLLVPRSVSSFEVLRRWQTTSQAHFYRLIGRHYKDFFPAWQNWLKSVAKKPEVANLLRGLPAIEGRVVSLDRTGDFTVSLSPAESDQLAAAECRVQHQLISPFDAEMPPFLQNMDVIDCHQKTHQLMGHYSYGDRVYIVIEYLTPDFHSPIRIWHGRLDAS